MTLEELIAELGQLYLAHGNLNVGVVSPNERRHTLRLRKVRFAEETESPKWNGPNSLIKLVLWLK
jgi:hypothetical protein